MSEKLKLEFDTKLKLQQVQIQRLIDETIELKLHIKCLRRENEDLNNAKQKLQDKYKDLRNDYDALESYCARISQNKSPSYENPSKIKVKSEHPTFDNISSANYALGYSDAPVSNTALPLTSSTHDDRLLHSVSPSDELSLSGNGPSVQENSVHASAPSTKPFRYEPPNRAEYEAYVDRNHICMADLCRHYQICETSRNTGISTPIDCYYAKHHKHRYLHVENVLQAKSHSYSKLAALCQASEKYCDYWDPTVAVKLYAAINEDKDGFFK